ncbi:MAG: aminoglycoside phosphotransferase family protein [Thermomicrobiales bacterium]
MPRRTMIPTTPDDLTPTWLEHALRESGALPAGTVSGLHWHVIGQEFGFTGVVVRLHPTYADLPPDAAAPASIIAKFPTAEPAAPSVYLTTRTRDAATARRHYERSARELRFYREIAPHSPVPIPRLLGGVDDDESGQIVFLLQDFPDATSGDVLRGCSAAEASLILAAIAPFHARWWGTDAFLWLPQWGGDRQARQERLAGQIDPFLERFGHQLPADVRHMVVHLGSHYAGVLAALHQAPATIRHADLHLDNVLFQRPEAEPSIVILDWQSVCRGPAAVDVAYVLFGSLDIDVRRAREAELLRHYHALLIEHGVTGYSIDELHDDCRRALLQQLAGTVGWLANADVDLFTGRERALVEAAIGDGRLVSALLDHDVASLLAA